MTKLLLAVAFCAAVAASANAQTSSSIPPRDPPFGKGIPDNDSMHQPSSAGSGYRDNAADEIPPRDPPFGKGELRNAPVHLPSSAVTQGELPKNAKKEARTKSALKKDNPKGSTKQDGAPASDTN